MKIKFNVKVGDQQIEIEDEVANQAEFFRVMAMWNSIPQVGPNGETDLRFTHRTPKGYDYYAIKCPSAGLEFKFGQLRNEKDKLFPKDWEPIMYGREDFDEDPGPEPPYLTPPTTTQRAAAPAPTNSQRAAAPSTSNVADIDATKYFTFQRKNGIDLNRAKEIQQDCTVGGKTHWNRAMEELQKLVTPAAPGGGLSDMHLKLQGILSQLAKLGMPQNEIDARLSRVCDGICEVEHLEADQVAKALGAFNHELRSRQNQRQQRTA